MKSKSSTVTLIFYYLRRLLASCATRAQKQRRACYLLTMAHLRLVANLFYVTQAMLVCVLVGSGSGTQKHALAVQATILGHVWFDD
jgi:hypothetical protein